MKTIRQRLRTTPNLAKQSGIAVWIILLAVALIAIIGVVLASSSGTDNGRTKSKQDATLAAAILNQGAGLAQAAQIDVTDLGIVAFAGAKATELAASVTSPKGSATTTIWTAVGDGTAGTSSYFKLDTVTPAVCDQINSKLGLVVAADVATAVLAGKGCTSGFTYVAVYDKQA